ncbi:MAG: hypothetical protein ACXWPX_09875 [Pseudobdellovibrio sp.]
MEPQFDETLEKLAPHMYVWILNTPANKKIVETIPSSDWYDSENGVTFFNVDSKKFTEQQFIELMGQLDDLHGPNAPARSWMNLEVYGVTPTFLLSEVLMSEYGVEHIEPTEFGFIATRNLN